MRALPLIVCVVALFAAPRVADACSARMESGDPLRLHPVEVERGVASKLVRAVFGPDRSPPVWTGQPKIIRERLARGCPGGADITFDVPVVDRSPMVVRIDVRDENGAVVLDRDFLAEDQRVRVQAWILGPGKPYRATLCAEDAAGNASCAPDAISFVGPSRRPRVYLVGDQDLSDGASLALEADVERVSSDHVAVELPPDEHARPADDGLRIDWPRALILAVPAALLLAGAAFLAFARVRRRRAGRLRGTLFGLLLLIVGAPRAADAWCGVQEGVVAPNGGLLVARNSLCDLALRSGREVIRLRPVRRDGSFPIFDVYRPTRRLVPGRSYRVIDRSPRRQERGQGPAVTAWSEVDRAPPTWTGQPTITSASQKYTCMGNFTDITFRVPVADASPMFVDVDVRHENGTTAYRGVHIIRAQEVRIVSSPLRLGATYHATLCAVDAAGNTSCAPGEISLFGPSPPSRVYVVGDQDLSNPAYLALEANVEYVPSDQVAVALPPDERARPADVGVRVDWPRVRTLALPAALLLACALAILGLARRRRRRVARLCGGVIVGLLVAAPRTGSAWCEPVLCEDSIVANGGLFIWDGEDPECAFALRGPTGDVPLEVARRDPTWEGFGLYRPARTLVTARHRLVTTAWSSGAMYGRDDPVGDTVRATPLDDVSAPEWTAPPTAVAVRDVVHCYPERQVSVAVPVTDQTPVIISLDVHDAETGRLLDRDVFVLCEQFAIIRVPIDPDVRIYRVAMCAEDAAGNRSCAPRPFTFLAPREKPVVQPTYGRIVDRQVIRPPPIDERLRAASPVGRRPDWRYLRGAAITFALLFAAGSLRLILRARRLTRYRTA